MAIKAQVNKVSGRNACPIRTVKLSDTQYAEVMGTLDSVGLRPVKPPTYHDDWLAWGVTGDVEFAESIKAINGGNRKELYRQAYLSGVRGARGNKDLAAIEWSDKVRQEQRKSVTADYAKFAAMDEKGKVAYLNAHGIKASVA